jgi:hypothetical protein
LNKYVVQVLVLAESLFFSNSNTKTKKPPYLAAGKSSFKYFGRCSQAALGDRERRGHREMVSSRSSRVMKDVNLLLMLFF